MNKNQIIRLQPRIEEQTEYIAIDFPFNAEIIGLLRRLEATFSLTSGFWLIPQNCFTLVKLKTLLASYGEVLCTSQPRSSARASENASRKSLSHEQVCQLLSQTQSLQERTLLSLMYASGLRTSELITLKLSDVDLERGKIFIRENRGRFARVSVLPHIVIDLLMEYLTRYQPTQYLFAGSCRGHLSAKNIQQIFKQATSQFPELSSLKPSVLRHSFARFLLMRGVPSLIIEALLGNSNIVNPDKLLSSQRWHELQQMLDDLTTEPNTVANKLNYIPSSPILNKSVTFKS